MKNLFFYGTLRCESLLRTVLGGDPDFRLVPAVLPGHGAFVAAGQRFPFLDPDPTLECSGLLAVGVDGDALERLIYYEGGFGYDLTQLSVQTEHGPEEAEVWMTPAGRFDRAAPFDLENWQARSGAIAVRAAGEVMQWRGRKTAGQVAQIYPMIEMRAASYVMGRAEDVPDAPSGLTRDDVQVAAHSYDYAEYFGVESYRFKFRHHDGSFSDEVNYASFGATDAALVLPYDPLRDRIMLVEQFRMGPWTRGDRVPWQLEPIAGRIDASETPETTAIREAREEAGLDLTGLELISRGYPTPGCSNEYFHVYLGLADLPDGIEGTGGLASENENIRSYVFSFDRAMKMLTDGEIRVVPLQMALFWLANHRDRLRAGA
ncbi:NUDIX domain-containing protein [Thalassovita sp.]|jgi:nudix-type nucleoside diphosphatase (YffH/AdpP family)|uniref:NUDIX domain-containing protein n=1 Tax=Thalassovita sp. TaxID=1979401 RepID=UPI003B5BC900